MVKIGVLGGVPKKGQKGSKIGLFATKVLARATLAVLFLPRGYAKKAFDKGVLTPF
jgi:hypothetical protein